MAVGRGSVRYSAAVRANRRVTKVKQRYSNDRDVKDRAIVNKAIGALHTRVSSTLIRHSYIMTHDEKAALTEVQRRLFEMLDLRTREPYDYVGELPK